MKQLIPVEKLCTYYKVEQSFFSSLSEYGLIELSIMEKSHCIHEDHIESLEKIIRMYHELDINMEGIDIIINLLKKLESQKQELESLKNKLDFYQDSVMV